MNRLSFYFEEYRAVFFALVIILLCTTFVGISYFMQFERAVGPKSQVNATITGYRRANGAIAGSHFVFTARLDNGMEITIDDWGKLPGSYRGPVTLEVKQGELTNKRIYLISGKP